MKNDLTVVGGYALATLVVALGLLWPYQVSAIGPGESKTALIAVPVLKTQGCELSLRGTQTSYKPGDMPGVEIRAVNPGSTPVSLTASLHLMVTPPVSPMARMMPSAREIWKGECPLVIAAQKGGIVSLTPNVKLLAGATGYFVLKVGQASTNGAGFAVEKPAAQVAARTSPAKG
ncbi:MAG: hypothetical protein NTW87_27925 [Planctomycetota bacterium]|nr:hypothetical protein [Planctomycetota bacterium]